MDPQNPITYFAETDARNKKIKFGIKAKDRLRHMYVIGKTGMGKSTLLENMAIQDIQSDNGLAVIDPHGSFAEKLLDYVPEHRINDVLYFAPYDTDFPVSFNIMEDVGPDKRHLVVAGLMATFEKIWADAWSARMAYILQNTLAALLEFPGATLLGVNRMYTDKEFRKAVIDNIKDISVKSFWVDEWSKYTDRYTQDATPAIQNKIGQFASNPLIRNIIGQSKSTFDIRKMMDEKKILIINLSKGRVGEGNARLLGSMLITKIYLAAMSRADLSAADINKAPNFYLYVDEFQSFANKSFADILSEARKYKLNLTIAHQYIEQMEEEVRDAVFGNVGTMITFRVGAFDAEVLEKEFSPTFTAEDLVNLGFAQIYLKLMIDGVSSPPFSATTMAPLAPLPESQREKVIEASRKFFARPKAEAEKEIIEFTQVGRSDMPPPPKREVDFRAPLGPEREISAPLANRNQESKNKNQGFEVKNTREETGIKTQEVRNERRENPQRPEEVKDQNKIAFAAAAEELKKKQENSPRLDLGKDLPKPKVSLNDLKPEHERVKIPTPQNLNSLKSALADVLAQKEKPQEIKVEVNIQNPPEKIQEKPKTEVELPKTSIPTHTREIPEDVLRKLLSVEEPKKM